MTNKDKLALLEEMLDLENGSLHEEMELVNVENWDSMAVIALIALLDENFDKIISASEIKRFKIIKNILEVME